MKSKSKFEDDFEELSMIGRGNFGAANLIKCKTTGNTFVSKKILLKTLSEKEQQGALLEANLLKQLAHPNIVSYK